MFILFLTLFFCCGVCESGEGDLGYSLSIGNAIDVFANYGDLSQVTQVVSADYEEDSLEIVEPFREKNIRVFENVTSIESPGDPMVALNIQLCETFEDLLAGYFGNFKIEGTEQPWKAFLGDWIYDEIMRTFGIEFDTSSDNCCYVLVKLSKTHRTVKMDHTKQIRVKEYMERAINRLDVNDTAAVRRFMKSYGTHYIDSYVTGNFIYQVFKYKRSGYRLLKAYVKRGRRSSGTDNLRFYFSSYFLKQVGDIRMASGNKRIEEWAKDNLRDSQYLFSRPSLLRLYYNAKLAFKLNDMLDNGALLGLGLKILKPLFRDRYRRDKYAEIVENDMKLWEVNA
ncbi:torso-like protein [Maniola jurtina]|uniref:torso-like protein n=1 Tax=Maniola jurtina TaxID=191418 RepID=UPI001E68EC98|nr:torso-like protein [Maniola jurtina]